MHITIGAGPDGFASLSSPPVKRFFKYLSPRQAWRDLSGFIAGRRPYEFLFAFPALMLTGLVVAAFWKDYATVKVPYRANIIYVESWPLTRSDADIKAQQVIDAKKLAEARAAQEKHDLERQQKFKKVDDWLTNRGI
jgi:hypothetical protein